MYGRSLILFLLVSTLTGCFVEVEVVDGKGDVYAFSSSGNISCSELAEPECTRNFLPSQAEYVDFIATNRENSGWEFSHWNMLTSGGTSIANSCDGSPLPTCTIYFASAASQDPDWTDAIIKLKAVYTPQALSYIGPFDGEVLDSSVSAPLSATAVDPHTGADLTSSIVWHSNIDGPVGLSQTLTPGRHVIQASVKDSEDDVYVKTAGVLVLSAEEMQFPELKSPLAEKGPVAATWDGRVQFHTRNICFAKFPGEVLSSGEQCIDPVNGSGRKVRHWKAWMFRPEVVSGGAQSSGPALNNIPSAAYSNKETLDHDPYVKWGPAGEMVASPSDTDGRSNMIAVYRDPNTPVNPYQSDEAGVSVDGGAYETYKIVIVGKVDCARNIGNMTNAGTVATPYYRCASSQRDDIFAMIPAHIIVKDPRTASAEIHDLGVDVPGDGAHALTATNAVGGQELFYGIEPAISADGRLMVFHGTPPTSLKTGFLYYTYNDESLKADGWSMPQTLSNMHWNDRDTLVGLGTPASPQVKFSDLYPIAYQPLKSPDGVEFGLNEPFPGAYPWLSFDGTEVSFSVIPNLHGFKRTGYSFIGKLTNWTTQYIDGPVNLSRGNVAPYIGNEFPLNQGQNQRAVLNVLYNGLHSTKGSSQSWRRLFVGQTGLSDTMWNMSLDVVNSALPVSKRKFSYQLFMSESNDYVEVPLDAVEDGHYILRWPMNELLEYNRSEILFEFDGTGPSAYFTHKRNAVKYDVKGTPDVSGTHWNGVLSPDTHFPFEFYNATAIWDVANDVVFPNLVPSDLKDETIGVNGNSIVSASGPLVTTKARSALEDPDKAKVIEQIQEIVDEQAFSVEIWVKPSSGSAFTFIDIPGLVQVSRNADGSIAAIVHGEMNTELESDAGATADVQWGHIAVVVNDTQVSLYVNGNVVEQTTLFSLLTPDPNTLSVSVGDTGASSTGETWIDEFAFSNVGRTTEEIRVSAYLHDRMEVASNFTATTTYAGLEQHLSDERDIGSADMSLITALGHDLFESSMLSRDTSGFSCASCHKDTQLFADDVDADGIMGVDATSLDIDATAGQLSRLRRNTPSLVNRLFGAKHMMDGRAGSLEAQALLPLANSKEMDLPIDAAVAKLAMDVNTPTDFAGRFSTIFNRQVNADDLAFSLASFVRSIILDPDTPAPVQSTIGKDIFEGKGRCTGCHIGPNFTDEKFHNVGISSLDPDLGLAEITGRKADERKFRTPSLWGVASTAPYFHDGSKKNLSEVVTFYNTGGDMGAVNHDFAIKPLGLTQSEMDDLVDYLENSFTGTLLSQ